MSEQQITEGQVVEYRDQDGILIPEEGRTFDVTVTRDGVESVQQITLHDTLVGLYSKVRSQSDSAKSQAEVFAMSAVYAGFDTEKAIMEAHPERTALRLNDEGKVFSTAYRLIDEWRKQGDRNRNAKAVATATKEGSRITDNQRNYAAYLVGVLATYDMKKVRGEILDILSTNEDNEGGQRGALMDAIFRGRSTLALVDPNNFGRRPPQADDRLVIPGQTTDSVEGDQVSDPNASNPDTTVTTDDDNGEDPF